MPDGGPAGPIAFWIGALDARDRASPAGFVVTGTYFTAHDDVPKRRSRVAVGKRKFAHEDCIAESARACRLH